MVAIINEYLFPVLLFAIYLCAVYVVVCYPKDQSRTTLEISEISSNSNSTTCGKLSIRRTITDSGMNCKISRKFSQTVENNNLSFEQVIPEVRQGEIYETKQYDNLHIQIETIINNLNKRQSRKICKSLGIQQKYGKIEKSLTFIKAEVRSLFKENPERVIAVVQEKLPELISITDQTPHIDEKIAS